jgi:ADP-heptose:LPS heptosyltransferase
LIRICAREINAEIFILGGEDQAERLQKLDLFFRGEEKPYHDMVGKLSLAESAALLASAHALVSTDTGIMHLGFAVGTRVVAIIHCNNPANRVGPYGYGARHRVVQLARPAHYQAPGDASMGDISAENVFQKLTEVWPS